MSVCFHETRETIDLLRRVVDKLDENNGCISATELWDSVERVPANVGSSDLTVARHGIRQMEGVSDVLRSFTSRLVSTHRAHISTIRRRARIPQLTIGSLPNEIILHIVKDALDCTEPIWLIRYSHVSSKIRNVILDSPSLWASIPLTLEIPARITTTIMNRSADFKLIVDIDISGKVLFSTRGRPVRSASVVSRLSAVLEHHHRWRKLTLSISGEPVDLILRHFPRVNLTSVSDLVVGRVGVGADFFQKWEFAPLEKLVWGNECSLPPFSMATQALRVCSLRFRESNANLMSIAAFLRAATSLGSLTLELEPLKDSDSEPAELSEIRLPYLEHLNIDFFSETDHSVILLKSILCPGLKDLTITAYNYAEYSDSTENMRERYPMLTAFTLVAASYYPDEDFFFDDIMLPLPTTIKDLKIKRRNGAGLKLRASRRNDIRPQNFCIFYPDLTELDLEGCTIREDSFYEKLSEILSNFCVSLKHFRPGRRKKMNKIEKEQEKIAAIMTLQRAGVLVATS